MRIGIDVGGTNTDAVLMDAERVWAGVKTSTTPDVTTGIAAAIDALQRQHPFETARVEAVMIGTTHFINALIEARNLAPTAAVRLGLPATASLPPMVDWPRRLIRAISGVGYLCHGGHEFDGRHISDIDPAELRRVGEDMAARGIRSIAIASVFSPVTEEFEERAAEIFAEMIPEAAISLSHEIGRVGLLERENATIVNAALRELAARIMARLRSSLAGVGINAPLYLSQNDGTLMDVEFAGKYPVATFASGPTNSMRGAAALSGMESCAVVDIGGTTSDIGVLHNGFPRQAAAEVTVAGIRTNFRMPDVLSIGVGGGSRIRFDDSGDLAIGPDSVGYDLTREALVFGGSTLTVTDVAVAGGRADLGDASMIAQLDGDLVRRVLRRVAADVQEGIERMRTSADPLPVVAVGGGSVLVPDRLETGGVVHRPEYYAVANAIGAAIAQVGGEVDRVFAITPGHRDAVLDEARQEATDRAIAAGAVPSTVEIVEFDEIPLPYLRGNATRVRMKAVGDLPRLPPFKPTGVDHDA
jgi:N-methylhydantoinase A/oxoprolinase/acetone carboxylase beta subunit